MNLLRLISLVSTACLLGCRVDSVISPDPHQAATGWKIKSAGKSLIGIGHINAKDRSTAGSWIVRESRDQGATWRTIDQASFLGPRGEVCTAHFAYDLGVGEAIGQPLIYVTGQVECGGTSFWVTRSSRNGGRDWVTSDFFSGERAAGALGVVVAKSGQVFVNGISVDTQGDMHMLVRAWDPTSHSWSSVYLDPRFSRGIKISMDRNGAIYSGGSVRSGKYETASIVRSTDGGKSWFSFYEKPLHLMLGSGINHLSVEGESLIWSGTYREPTKQIGCLTEELDLKGRVLKTIAYKHPDPKVSCHSYAATKVSGELVQSGYLGVPMKTSFLSLRPHGQRETKVVFPLREPGADFQIRGLAPRGQYLFLIGGETLKGSQEVWATYRAQLRWF